jgi:pyrroline-5-carboxylate reductase
VWTATPTVQGAARDAVRMLPRLGKEIYVDSEKYVDMATAVSSSGPAYVFLVMEAMIDAAVHIGLRRDMAVPMVIQTLLGSSRYAQESGRHPAELRNQVTSPGGTTTEGLAFKRAARRFRYTIEAVQKSADQDHRPLGMFIQILYILIVALTSDHPLLDRMTRKPIAVVVHESPAHL